MSDEGWLIDAESGLRYKEPEDKDDCVWFVNYVAGSGIQNGKYVACYGSIGPMIYTRASALFDRMDKGSTTMCNISKEDWRKFNK